MNVPCEGLPMPYGLDTKRCLSSDPSRMVLTRVDGMLDLKEPVVSYSPVFDPQNSLLSRENRVK
jgi:hypothetical protein